MKIKDFFNKVLNSDKIYYAEEIGGMTPDEFRQNESAIDFQLNNLGIPREADLAGSDEVYVRSYTRSDGTKVRAYYRSRPGHGSEGFPTGASASHVSQSQLQKADFTGVGSLLNEVEKNINHRMNFNYQNAEEMANIYLVKPKNSPKSSEYQYISPGFADLLNKEYSLSGNKTIDKDWPGIIFNKNSSLFSAVSNSTQMQDEIREQYDSRIGRFKKDKLDINFTNDPNLLRSLGHATILKPYIDEYGYFNGILFDKYDFAYEYIKKTLLNKDVNYKDFVIPLMATYFSLRGISNDRNYYILLPVRFKW